MSSPSCACCCCRIFSAMPSRPESGCGRSTQKVESPRLAARRIGDWRRASSTSTHIVERPSSACCERASFQAWVSISLGSSRPLSESASACAMRLAEYQALSAAPPTPSATPSATVPATCPWLKKCASSPETLRGCGRLALPTSKECVARRPKRTVEAPLPRARRTVLFTDIATRADHTQALCYAPRLSRCEGVS